MKVLWVCSFSPSIVAEVEGWKSNNFGGWIDGALDSIKKNSNIEIGVSFLQRESEKIKCGHIDGCSYYGVYIRNDNYLFEKSLIDSYNEVIDLFQPDLIQIWGTEFPCFLAMLYAAKGKTPVITYIQGLCGFIAKHYYACLPNKIVQRYTVRDFIRLDNIKRQRDKFLKRGDFEKKMISNSDYIIGRTDFDRACVTLINPNVKYFHCNETLRYDFYACANTWNYENCEKHSVFVSQASYPLKGFHHVIDAVEMLKQQYPDIKIYTTGINPFDIPWYRINSYQKYLCELIMKYELKDNIVFLGTLNSKEMCSRFLKSNVFVSASSIENSPNSVGEAMLLGMPVVASFVGGTMNLLKDKVDGFLFQADAPYMLSYYIRLIFDMKEDAKEIGENAFYHAALTHNQQQNLNTLISIYKEVFDNDM